jgi:diguanylate cyclase (GGDEF)-like protein
MPTGGRYFFEPRTKREALRLVYVYTAIAIVVAVAVTYVTNFLTNTPMGPSLIRAVVIPLLLAPWMVWTVARFALRLEKMRRELEGLVHTDPLSGALNRRGVAEYADNAFAQQRATGKFSVIVMDVDRFKSINDQYGHAAGDMVIARIAEITRQVVGDKNCAVGRLGGDELVALLTGRSLAQTTYLAETLRNAIEHRIFTNEDQRLTVTTSIGVAIAFPHDQNAEAVLKRADQSLYAAKGAGRNLVRAAA